MDRITGGRKTRRKKERKKVVEEKSMLKSVKQVESVKLVAEIKITKLKYFSLILILKLLKNDTTTKT